MSPPVHQLCVTSALSKGKFGRKIKLDSAIIFVLILKIFGKSLVKLFVKFQKSTKKMDFCDDVIIDQTSPSPCHKSSSFGNPPPLGNDVIICERPLTITANNRTDAHGFASSDYCNFKIQHLTNSR